MQIIDGKKIANEIKAEIAAEVKQMIDNGEAAPHLAVVVVGDDGAAQTYVDSIKKNCQSVGFTSSIYHFPKEITEKEFLDAIDFLNNDIDVDGYIIQLPLPKHISNDKVIAHVNPEKDMDCFHPANMGNLLLGKDCYLPATPHGTMELLRRAGIETEGKNCVVLGRSNIVGKPLAMLLAQKDANATVTICHSKTKNLKRICAKADILFVAIGQAEMITADYVKPDAVVIDIGIHRVEDPNAEKGYRVCGDVNFNDVVNKCSAITPVPGGVGSMTTTCLLLNTLKARKKKM